MMFWTALGCAICLIVFIAVQLVENQTQALGWVAAAAAIVYNIIFGYGWLGPPWVYGPEVIVSLINLEDMSWANKATNRLHLFNNDISPVLSEQLESGCPHSSWSLAVELELK